MNIPFLNPLVNAAKQWADIGPATSREASVNPFSRQPKLSFDERFQKPAHSLKLSDVARADLLPRLGFSSVTNNEVDLALSRTPADLDYTMVANHVKAVISAFRVEHPEDSDAAAARKLLEGSASLAAIDARAEQARLAAEQARAEEKAFERSYHEFKSIPGKHKALTDKIANLEFERSPRISMRKLSSCFPSSIILSPVCWSRKACQAYYCNATRWRCD